MGIHCLMTHHDAWDFAYGMKNDVYFGRYAHTGTERPGVYQWAMKALEGNGSV